MANKNMDEIIVETQHPKNTVLDEESAAKVFGGKTGRGKKPQPHVAEPEEDPTATAMSTLEDALNRRTFTWKTPSVKHPVTVTFRRPPGGTREMVYRVLGPEQCNNDQLVREYIALASILEIDNNPVMQPNSRSKFDMLKRRVGWVKTKDGEDWYDEIVALFIVSYDYAMYPDRFEAMAEAEAAGLSSDDVRRVASMAGLERPKASPAPSS